MRILDELSEREKRQLEIMDLYNDGYTYKDIGRIMFMNENTIKGIVKNWINSLPAPNRERIWKIHRQASFSRRDTRKAIEYEAKKEIGDKAFILKNRSIYNTKRNGDIVLKDESEIGCSVSFDTPRRLINENKEIEYKNLKDEEIKLEVLSFYSRKNREKLN
ncbi:helix-turn-helix domain-containing protein [Clostridium perfringens]|nr:helix-turn-helix domain-containing protein [Clostridium perfringens]